jgi:two-component system, OmpR family, heavy metal sensor histidine kinase CusS
MSSSQGSGGTRSKDARSFVAEATSLLAHDLNNQLALLLANFEFLSEFFGDRDDVDADVRETVTTSQAALQHMMTLVRNMSDIARMEDPGLYPSPVATDLTKVIRAVVREHRPLHDRGAVEMRVECPEALRAEVDPTLLRRVAHNLVSNARRFVEKNGVVRVTCALEAVPDGQDVVLTVSNSGPAIPPERRATLFDKYRVNPDGRVARGMGLYFCRLASDAHGGSITLSEDAEFPTVFTVRLACGARAGARPPAA